MHFCARTYKYGRNVGGLTNIKFTEDKLVSHSWYCDLLFHTWALNRLVVDLHLFDKCKFIPRGILPFDMDLVDSISKRGGVPESTRITDNIAAAIDIR